uniref:Transposase n=1 Tax=Mesocestoides corti TaxID=53468 RepID=A0A5K3FUL6_MESCO
MGLAHSFTKRHRAKPKEFSLDAFVVDLVKGMAEATVDSVIKERRWTLNAPRCLGGDVGVTNGFSRNPSSSSPPPSPQAKSAAASRQHGVIAGDAVAKCSSPDLKVLSSKDEFFRSAFLSVDQQGANDAKKVDYSQDQADSSEDSSRSTLESTNSTTSSSPLEDSTNTDVTSTPARSPEEDVIGLIANTASRTAPLFQEALHFFWDLRT